MAFVILSIIILFTTCRSQAFNVEGAGSVSCVPTDLRGCCGQQCHTSKCTPGRESCLSSASWYYCANRNCDKCCNQPNSNYCWFSTKNDEHCCANNGNCCYVNNIKYCCPTNQPCDDKKGGCVKPTPCPTKAPCCPCTSPGTNCCARSTNICCKNDDNPYGKCVPQYPYMKMGPYDCQWSQDIDNVDLLTSITNKTIHTIANPQTSYIYRSLNQRERLSLACTEVNGVNIGVVASWTSSNREVTIFEHVAGDCDWFGGCWYVSFSYSPQISWNKYRGSQAGYIAKVDMDDIPSLCKIYDLTVEEVNNQYLTDENGGVEPYVTQLAYADREVLIWCPWDNHAMQFGIPCTQYAPFEAEQNTVSYMVYVVSAGLGMLIFIIVLVILLIQKRGRDVKLHAMPLVEKSFAEIKHEK